MFLDLIYFLYTKKDDRDASTKRFQAKLIELGYLEVANGVNDKTSQSAIKLFQEKNGLIVDGTANVSGATTFSGAVSCLLYTS